MVFPPHIILDAIGGDYTHTEASTRIGIGLKYFLNQPENRAVRVTAVTVGDLVEEHYKRLGIYDRVEFVLSDMVFPMDYKPEDYARENPDTVTTIMRACQLIQQPENDELKGIYPEACVLSIGNTAALVHYAAGVLGTPRNVIPSLLTRIPTRRGDKYMIDVGVNPVSTHQVLYRNALIGATFLHDFCGIEEPVIGLLSYGQEAFKAKSNVKKALLVIAANETNPKYSYTVIRMANTGGSGELEISLVESKHVFDGLVDLVVCSGDDGNSFIKTGRAAISYGLDVFKEEAMRTFLGKLGLWLIKRSGAVDGVRERMGSKRYSSAYLLPMNGKVIKAHGNSDVEAIVGALSAARDYSMSDAVWTINDVLGSIDDKVEITDVLRESRRKGLEIENGSETE